MEVYVDHCFKESKVGKIKVSAVVCRPGFADSEVVTKEFTKSLGKAPKKGDYAEIGADN